MLLREGRLVKLTEKIVVHKRYLEEIERKVREFFQKNSELTVSDFKKIVGEGVSRKYLIPMLEYLDKQKITLRLGDKRVLRKA
ncbi:MAG: SelB C-terminal domain-containing protein [Caldimicrobium sp.]